MGATNAPTSIVLIRHGESRAQVERFVSGHDTCTGLSDLGRAQALALRDRLLKTGELRDATAAYTSVLPRAMETAALIAPAIGDGLDADPHCDWCEQHPGEGEGLSWDEYDERFGTFEERADRSRRRAPGSESVSDFVRRVDRALGRVVDRHVGERVVVVAHGGVVGCALEVLAGVPFGSVVRYVENTSITEFIRDEDGRWWLARLNDAAHLG